MANVTGKLDELYAKIKSELATFLNNQSILLAVRKKLPGLTAPGAADTLTAQYDKLYAQQTRLEDRATDWMGKAADLKKSISSNPYYAQATSGNIASALLNADFWTQVTRLTNAALPIINEGIGLSMQLVTQNGDVELLRQSVEGGVVMVPTAQTAFLNNGMLWIYGIAGLGLAWVLAQRKKGKRIR